MPESPSYANRLRTKASRETARFIHHKLLTGACVTTAVVIVRLALWHFHRLTLTWAEVWITLLTIVGSYGIVVIGAFVVNLFRAPWLLDAERAQEIVTLTDKLKSTDPLNRQKQTNVLFANLMDKGQVLTDAFSCSADNPSFSTLIPDLLAWVGDTVAALQEAGFETDAVGFSHSGTKPPSPAQIAEFSHLPAWKRYQLAQLSAYRQELKAVSYTL